MVENKGLIVIGHFCWWSINECKISRDDLQAQLTAAGIDFEVPEVQPRSAFLKAIREVKTTEKAQKLLIRKIKKGADEYTFGLVDETIDTSAVHLSYSHTATMHFNQESGNIFCDNEQHRAYQAVREKYFEFKDFLTSDDVRSILLDILSKFFTVSVRQRGGIYFVADKFSAEVAKIETVVAGLPGENYFAAVPQFDAEKSKNAIYKAFLESLKDRLAAFEQDLNAEDGISQKAALKNRLEDFKNLKTEIEFYRDALQFQAEDFTARLDGLTQKVRDKLLN